MKKRIAAASLLAFLFSAVLVVMPSTILAERPGSVAERDFDQRELKWAPPSFSFDDSEFTKANNCTWTCSDGRTGGAEVNTEQQCANACAGACGGPCVAADEDDAGIS